MAKRQPKPKAVRSCVLDCDDAAAPNSAICTGHGIRAANGLRALATFARDSYEYELASALAVSTTPPLSGSKNPPMIVNERIADHRIAVRGLLASWSLNVSDERNIGVTQITGICALAGPLCPQPPGRRCVHESCRRLIQSRRPLPDGVYGVLAGFLRRHHDWIMCQYFAKDYAAEIIAAADTAFQLLNPSGTRVQRDIGPCAETGCGGSLYAIRRDTEDLLPSAIKCNVCGAEIPSTKWVKFGRKLLEQREKEQAA